MFQRAFQLFLFNRKACSACSIALLLLSGLAGAQPENGEYNAYTVARDNMLANTQTVPVNDAVLSQAPGLLQLKFPSLVRLVKLTLHNDSRDWVDINFRYNPRLVDQFSLSLPRLQDATYYTADWAVLGDNDQLIRGSFSFAFGPTAESPSLVRAARERFLEQRMGNDDESVRTVNPPPTRIIINQDPQAFDPPFTIILDGDNDDLQF